jgi:hypothetical protein
MAARLASELWRGHQNRQRNCHTETTFIHAADLSAEISLFEFLKRLPELLHPKVNAESRSRAPMHC